MGVRLTEDNYNCAVRGLPGVLHARADGQVWVQNAGIVAGVKIFVSGLFLILKAPPIVSICLLTMLTGKATKPVVSVVFAGENA